MLLIILFMDCLALQPIFEDHLAFIQHKGLMQRIPPPFSHHIQVLMIFLLLLRLLPFHKFRLQENPVDLGLVYYIFYIFLLSAWTENLLS